MSVTNFDDIDEEDKAGRKTRLFKRDETQGYLDVSSLDAASVHKVCALYTLFERRVDVYSEAAPPPAAVVACGLLP